MLKARFVLKIFNFFINFFGHDFWKKKFHILFY